VQGQGLAQTVQDGGAERSEGGVFGIGDEDGSDDDGNSMKLSLLISNTIRGKKLSARIPIEAHSATYVIQISNSHPIDSHPVNLTRTTIFRRLTT
jgi:hypothetical protein